jgi:hypothetical protein
LSPHQLSRLIMKKNLLKHKAIVASICLPIALVFSLVTPAMAQPPLLPHMFYGSVTIGGQPAPAGTVIEARGDNIETGIAGNPVACAVAGQYGSVSNPRLYVQGADVSDGDVIEFYINGSRADETYAFQGGGLTELNLSVAEAPASLPASFIVVSLDVSPLQVEVGDTVTIEAEVTNSGGTEGTYTAILKIDGVEKARKNVVLAPGEEKTVSFVISTEEAGDYLVELGGEEALFVVTGPTASGASLASAAFSVDSLSISPETANIGGSVSISVRVLNTGEETGTYLVTLMIDGVSEETKEVNLAGGEYAAVTFTTARDEPGTYSVEVNGLTGSFTVAASTAPAESPASPTSPSTAQPQGPSETPAPGSNWWLIGGIIAACAVAVAVPLWLRRRRRSLTTF